jgi:hypothetical protein
MNEVDNMKSKINKLIQLWFFGPEKEFTKDIPTDFEKEIHKQAKEFTKGDYAFPRFTVFLESIEKIDQMLTSRIIPSGTASMIHGLNNQNITDWDRVGIVYADRKGERGKRYFSVVDVAWLLILRMFQDRFGAQLKLTAELLLPLLDDGYLRCCLLRDLSSEHKAIAYIDEGNRLKVSFTNSSVPSDSGTSLIDKIPITSIMDMVVKNAGIPGFTTFEIEGKRYFQIEGKMICLAESFQAFVDTKNTESDEFYAVRCLLKALFVKSPELTGSIFDLADQTFPSENPLKAYFVAMKGGER